MFRLLGRYIFKEILTSAALGTLLATFVIFLHGAETLFALLVQASRSNIGLVGRLFALAVPPVLPLTVPFGVLVGILIGLGRMAADGEIIAMRANGLSSRRIVAPVLVFAALGMACAGYASLRLNPLAMRESTAILAELMKTQLSAEIQPRVFDEDFPNRILYVGEVKAGEPGDPVRWFPVFLADVSPPEERSTPTRDQASGPVIYTAREAVVVSYPQQRRMQLSMHDATTHMMGNDGAAHDASAPKLDMALDAAPPKEQAVRSSSMMSTSELMRYRAGPNLIEYKIELHRRFALPVACVMLAMVGIPLGIATRKGGKSAGYVNAVFLAFFCYYLSSITLIGFARQQKLPVPLAIWLPDAAFGLAGLFLIYRMERPGDRDLLAGLKAWFGARLEALKSRAGRQRGVARFSEWRTLLPQVVDTYILSQFVFYFTLLLTSFVSLTLIYNFFELMNEMVKNRIPLMKMFTYLFFLTPELIYRTLPVSVLVAVLVTFGILSKQNEVVAFRACGVSLYRLALPILICGTVLSAGLFAFDFYYVPGANRRQEALRNEIKGRPTQTYVNPDRKWIMGSKGSIIYYYRYFDAAAETMAGVSVFELNPKSFHLVRQVSAETAHWNRPQKTWVFENGWYSDFDPSRSVHRYTATTFPELADPPDYFLKEQVPEQQMNFIELERYIGDLQRSGFDTVRLQVQFFRKFSVPLFALIMALLAVPFSFMVGNRGAMTGIGLSIVIAIAYWGVSTLFEKVGDYSQLPAAMAAWSPDVIFSLAGLYMLLRVRS